MSSGPSSAVGKDSNATVNAKTAKAQTPLIPEDWIDVPTQRLYILSLGLLIQAIKAFDWFHTFLFPQASKGITFKWLLVDLAYCISLKNLRIPRLNYATAAVLLQVVILWLLDGVLFGSIQIGVRNYSLSTSARELYYSESASGRLSNLRNYMIGDDHLKGEHTVRMSPVSTAKLNPYGDSFCLTSPTSTVLIPILLNNTKPSRLQYSFTHLGTSKFDIIDVTAKDLRAIEYERMEHFQSSKLMIDDDDYNEDDYDPEDEIEATSKYQTNSQSNNGLEPTESIVFLKINKPGVITLLNVTDFYAPNRVKVYSSEIMLVPCPRAYFIEDDISRGGSMKCSGGSEELSVAVSGIPPLSLTWHREINGRYEHFTVEKIDGTPERTNEAQEVFIPLAMSLDIPGSHSYILDSVIDGMGNVQTLTPKFKSQIEQGTMKTQQTEAIRSVTVLTRASMSFKDCAPGQPVSLLKGGSAPLVVSANDADPRDGPWKVTVRYSPPASTRGEEKTIDHVHSSDPGSSVVRFNTHAAGLFQIVDVRGTFCPGDILSPDFCRVVEEPYPTADVEWKTIHECSGDTGASAYLRFSGKPPFKVVYQQKRNGEATKEMTKTFFSSRGEIVFQPESSGNYSYELLYLSDANYAKRKLQLPAFNTVVHPLASANFANQDSQGVGMKRTINSCSGDFVDVDVDLRGDGPWNVELQIASPRETKIVKKTGLKKNRERIRIDIPRLSEDESSSLYIDLVSVEDSYGCRKDLAVPGVVVNVRRLKPTVRFYAKEGRSRINVLEKQEAKIPLRLTGEGPWSVEYRRLDSPGSSKKIVIHSANGDLVVKQEGLYELIGVSDAFCSGTVVKDQSKFRIDWISRPTISISPDSLTALERRNNSHIRRPVCEGNEDHVELDLTGKPPFQIKYTIASSSEAGGVKILDAPTISSVQTTTRVQLFTSEAGRIHYEVKQVGDANYPVAQNRDHTKPFKERLLFEQEVIARPSASFKSPSRLAYCLHDNFATQGDSNTAVVYLEGRAPFYIDLTIRSLTTSSIHHETVEIRESQWTVSLPNYVFTSIGAHSVTIDSVRDSSSCQQITRGSDNRVLWVDVAESATIVPFDRREHICIGENTQFQLEGIPPWTIEYNVNGKVHEQAVKQSPFVFLQQHPGDFEITSIAHQNRMCSSSVQNIHFTVHSLPAAQVAHGRDILEDIHEGSQAHIVFTLTGEPPFTFTYQRSEAPVKKGTKPGKTLETHTVSGVMSNEYSIYSALEGTWTVTSISDKYCRYPPVQLETSGEK